MKKIGMFKGMSLCKKYSKMNEEERKKVREERIREMVLWAKHNSPYYAKLYEKIDDKFNFTELPPVCKLELMKNFDEWVVDNTIKLADINEFMKDLDNVGRKFNGKYIIFTTSGSTGNPLVSVCDSTTGNMLGAINAGRTFARKSDLLAFFKRGGKTIGVFANGGFYLGYSSVRERLLKMPWKKKQMAVTSALLPINQIVDELNAFQPAMLGGYPSNLELLIDEQKSGRLHISPVLVMTGGEYLSDTLRERLSKAFNCYVQTSYACTEGGTVACECKEQHFHINDDWLVVEPVDKDNKPVADGVLSDKILLTNLFNFTQPYIRYEVTDRVVMHHEKCKCGNPSPWLTLEGRTDDVVQFTQDGQEKKIAPLAIYATLKEVHELRRFQMLAYPDNKIELRLETVDGIDKVQAFDKAKLTLLSFFKEHGLTQLDISLSDEVPQQDKGSGKFKHIINNRK